MDGILLLDKPAGPTSNRVLNAVRRWAGTRKAGHTGTLDPLATGLLPALVGRATRLAPFLPAEPKQYRARLEFGKTTDTADADGNVLDETDPGQVPPAEWELILARHIGDIDLPVPAYAAVKINGRALYKYARAGHSVELPVRTMTVYELSADTSAWPVVEIEMTCGTGTYVRALAESLGRECGCGAHVVELRRTKIAAWDVHEAVAPDQLVKGELPDRGWIPIDAALKVKTIALAAEQAERIFVGRPPETVLPGGEVRLAAGERFAFADDHGHLLAVARSKADWRGASTPPEFDFERVLVSR